MDRELEVQLRAQELRRERYENGEYELSDDEGFYCEDCSWTGLTAPMNMDYDAYDDDSPITICPECGGPTDTHGTHEKYLKPFVEEVSENME